VAGWRNDPDRLLVITSDVRCYEGARERSAAWIDGSLFVMSLVYAFHSFGLGTCCLNLNVTPRRAAAIRRVIGAHDAEVLIVLLAAGWPQEQVAAACSARRPAGEIWRKV